MLSESRGRRLLLHTSDLHLSRLGDDASRGLEAVIDLAIDREVDIIIVAGDLFDRGNIDDAVVGFVAGQMRRPGVPVVLLPGNHDCLLPGTVLTRPEFRRDSGHIHVVAAPGGEMLRLPGLAISLWGKAIDSYDEDLRPLADPPPGEPGYWNIAVGHGYYVSSGAPDFPSYNITEDEIQALSEWDYIALGHVPVFRCVCNDPVACYCGSPLRGGAVVMVEMDETTGVRVSQCPV